MRPTAVKPEMLEWLLDHGADIEHREQDYGSTPLNTAVVMRNRKSSGRSFNEGPMQRTPWTMHSADWPEPDVLAHLQTALDQLAGIAGELREG